VVQETDYPAADKVRLTVRKAGNGRFAMKLRIPAWSKGATVSVNGKARPAAAGQLAVVDRVWKAGDTVELNLPQPLRTLAIDDQNPNLQALMRGAVMYVGINPWEGIENQAVALPHGLQPMPGQPEAYRTNVDGRDLVFVPYYAVDTERTATYFKTA
jgi:DUF1680 family protein